MPFQIIYYFRLSNLISCLYLICKTIFISIPGIYSETRKSQIHFYEYYKEKYMVYRLSLVKEIKRD